MRQERKICLCLLLLASGLLVAQPRLRSPEIYIGGHAGVMASTVLFKPSIAGMDILQSPLSVNGGLVFRYAGNKVCAIQAEVNYMQRGWREVSDGIDYRRQLDYIEIPLLMHIYLGGEHFRGFLNLGPQIGYCFRDISFGNGVPTQLHQYKEIDNPFDWGLAAGLGMYYRTKKIGLFQLEARFNYSFGSVFSTSKIDYFSSANPINLSINLAYLWEIKIK